MSVSHLQARAEAGLHKHEKNITLPGRSRVGEVNPGTYNRSRQALPHFKHGTFLRSVRKAWIYGLMPALKIF